MLNMILSHLNPRRYLVDPLAAHETRAKDQRHMPGEASIELQIQLAHGPAKFFGSVFNLLAGQFQTLQLLKS